MEEDRSVGDTGGQENGTNEDTTESKKLKSSDSALGKSEDSSSKSESASTSTETHSVDSGFKGFPRSEKAKNRNYRNRRIWDHTDSEHDEEDEPDEPMECATETSNQGSDEEENENQLEDCEDDEEDDDRDDDGDMLEDLENERNSSFSDDEDDDDEDDVILASYDNTSDSSSNDSGGIPAPDHPLLQKPKPKHNWFIIDEITKRQFGARAKLQSSELFQRRCYGSLHCVSRLELMYKLEAHAGCVNSLNFHPDGKLLASGSDDLKVIIWDWKIGRPMLKYKTKHKGNVFQSKFLHLPGDIHIVSCARDGQVRLAQLSSEKGLRDQRLLGSHKGPCHKLVVLPEQPQIILSAGEDGVILNHDVRCPKSSKILTVKEDEMEIALYSIHGNPLNTNEFVVSGRDPIVRVYDQRKPLEPKNCYSPFKNIKAVDLTAQVTCAIYNYNGSEILASYTDSDVYLFDVNNSVHGNFLHKYEGHRNGATIKGVNFFGPKSEFVVSGSDCGHVYFWERNTEALVQWVLADDNGVVNCLEPHPQLPFICTSGLDWDVKVWAPSCEEDPKMVGLKDTLTSNAKNEVDFVDPVDHNASQMLWMLWRHLRRQHRTRGEINPQDLLDPFYPSDSESLSSPEDSDQDTDRSPNNCTTS